MADDFPCWLGARARSVASALLQDGFFYCGHADDFCSSPGLETVGNWEVGGTYQAPGFDAVCDGALFCKDYSENCELLVAARKHKSSGLQTRKLLAQINCK